MNQFSPAESSHCTPSNSMKMLTSYRSSRVGFRVNMVRVTWWPAPSSKPRNSSVCCCNPAPFVMLVIKLNVFILQHLTGPVELRLAVVGIQSKGLLISCANCGYFPAGNLDRCPIVPNLTSFLLFKEQ